MNSTERIGITIYYENCPHITYKLAYLLSEDARQAQGGQLTRPGKCPTCTSENITTRQLRKYHSEKEEEKQEL